MADRMLDKYTRTSVPSGPLPEPEAEIAELGCFGWLRGIRDHALMLELRKRDGTIVAIGYSWLGRIEFDPAQGITLFTPGQKVIITGTGLNAELRPTVRLFEGITRHRVPWVREASRSAVFPADNGTVVESIQLRE